MQSPLSLLPPAGGAEDGKGLVPVHRVAVFIHRKAPVRVAVRPRRPQRLCSLTNWLQRLQMGGAAVPLMFRPSGRSQRITASAPLGKQLRRCGAGAAVGAVHRDPHAREAAWHGGSQVGHIVGVGVFQPLHPAQVPAG